jgi:hypothetical protein
MDVWAAATGVARELGVEFDRVTPLRATNNIVAWLEPSAVVARVSTDPARAAREIAIAARLEALAAPVVGPASGVPPIAHPAGDRVVTFWRYEPQVPGNESEAGAQAAALAALHDRLRAATAAQALPDEPADVPGAIAALAGTGFAPQLAAADRSLLRAVLVAARAELSGHTTVIHGSPHAGNILTVAGRPRFIDFETVCRGPVEWDLAHLAPDVAATYPAPVDRALVEHLRPVVSAVTATWCAGALDRGPDMGAHADHHLARVRAARPATDRLPMFPRAHRSTGP